MDEHKITMLFDLYYTKVDSTDGENIFNQIISFCNSNEISYYSIIHLGVSRLKTLLGRPDDI